MTIINLKMCRIGGGGMSENLNTHVKADFLAELIGVIGI